MDTVVPIRIDIQTADGQQKVERLNRSLDALQRAAGGGRGANDNLRDSLDRATRSAAGLSSTTSNLGKEIAGAGREAGRASGGVSAMARGMDLLKGAIVGFIGLETAKKFMEMADASGLMEAKLRLATQGWGSYAKAQADVNTIAAQTRSEVTSTATLYGKLAKVGKTLDASQAQVARSTRTVIEALKVSGATSEETASSVLQLGQALSSGKLQGDEFRSLMENSPRLMQLFADSIGKPVGQLKAMATAGTLTSDVIFKALNDPKFTAKLDEEFKLLPKTFDDAFTSIKNTATKVFGAFNTGGQFSDAFYNFASTGANNLAAITAAARSTGEEIRSVFAGLSTAFSPMLAAGNSLFDALGIRVQSFATQVRGILAGIDTLRNALPDLQRSAQKWDEKHLGFRTGFTGDVGPRSNLEGEFRKGAAQARMDSARATLIGNVRTRTGDFAFSGAGMSFDEINKKFWSSKLVKQGGSGNIKSIPGAASKSDDTSEADRRAKAEAEFWRKLNDEVASAKLFGIEQQKITKEQELQKALGHELSAQQKSRVDTAVQQIANEKAISSLKESAFELDNSTLVLQQRAVGLTDEQSRVQDAIDGKKLSALNAGVDITSAAYQEELKSYSLAVQRNVAEQKKNELLSQAVDSAKKYSAAFAAQDDLVNLQKEQAALAAAYAAGALKDALGQPITETVYKSIMSGFDAAAQEVRGRPLQVIAQYAGDGSYAAQLSAIASENANYQKAKDQIELSGLDPASKARLSADVEKAHADGMNRATRIVANKFISDFTSGIDDLANLFGGVMGDVLNGFSTAIKSIQGNADGSSGLAKMSNLLGSKFSDGFKSANASMLDVSKGIKNLSNPLGDIKNAFSGKDGSFLKGMGQAVGGAMAGLKIGESIGSLGKALGLKGFETGAKIGGTIGGLTGNPIIAAAASVVGGLISSIFYKPKYGTAAITGGAAKDINLTGNKGSVKDAANSAAGAVQLQLKKIADAFGGTVGSFSVAIGQWDKQWRVNDDATTKALHYNNFTDKTLHNFGDDAEGAIAYAVQNAIEDGAIKGIAGWAQNALKDAGADLALSLFNSVKSVNDELDSLVDPMGASVRQVINPINDLIDQMKKYGATAADTAKAEQLKTEKIKALLKEQTSTYRSILEDLNGSTGGFTAVSQLVQQMAKLQGYQSDFAAGKTVDQSEYGSLIDKILQNAQSAYGNNSTDYQNIISQIRTTTSSAIDSVTKYINTASGGVLTAPDPSIAIKAQTDALTSQLTISNNFAAQSVSLLTQLVQNSQSSGGGGLSVVARNGKLLNSY